tara:strand:+ start:404 stop:664 length:261 start_codon:yes stop_codon:yes gene_type:complete
MKSFKQYISENILTRSRKKNAFRPQDMQPVSRTQPDFNDPAYNHQFNVALKDSEKWPPKPAAKYKADQIRWAVSAGKQPEHLAKES